jgi:hypothetical protein
MRRWSWIIVFFAAACILPGCGGSQPSASQQGQGDAGTQVASGQVTTDTTVASDSQTASAPPADIVASFYNALREGNNTAIAGLLTDKAREETAKSGLEIQSQASAALEYSIGETDFVTDQLDGAHVMSLWSEPGPDGLLLSTQVVWVLRKQPDGWKISGMATPVEEGQLPLLFNFECPEDMMQKKSYVESRMASSADSLDGGNDLRQAAGEGTQDAALDDTQLR